MHWFYVAPKQILLLLGKKVVNYISLKSVRTAGYWEYHLNTVYRRGSVPAENFASKWLMFQAGIAAHWEPTIPLV